MREIAARAGGVHPSTVSLALHNFPGISAGTRHRIQTLARKMGYRPDPLIDAFNLHRLEVLPHKVPPVLAYVTDYPNREAMEASPAHREIWEAARAEAHVLHCRLDLFPLARGDRAAARLNSILQARAISGVILGAFQPKTACPDLRWAEFSVVCVECAHFDLPSYAVCSDHRRAARFAFRRLLADGRRRIGLAADPRAFPGRNEMYLAACLVEYSRLPSSQRIAPLSGPLIQRGTNRLAAWMARWQVDAVLTDRPDFADFLVGRSTWAGAWACVGLPIANPGVAGMVTDNAGLGSQAVKQVVSLMRTNERGLPAVSSVTYVPATWLDGASAPPLRHPGNRRGLKVGRPAGIQAK